MTCSFPLLLITKISRIVTLFHCNELSGKITMEESFEVWNDLGKISWVLQMNSNLHWYFVNVILNFSEISALNFQSMRIDSHWD